MHEAFSVHAHSSSRDPYCERESRDLDSHAGWVDDQEDGQARVFAKNALGVFEGGEMQYGLKLILVSYTISLFTLTLFIYGCSKLKGKDDE